MVMLKLHGEPAGTVGDRKLNQYPGTKAARPPLFLDRYTRNGQHPDADFMNEMCNAYNQGAITRSKEVFSYAGILGAAMPSAVSSTRKRWRFAFHTSPAHNLLLCNAVMYPSAGTGATHQAYAKLTIEDVSGTPITTAEFTYGNTPFDPASVTGWQFLKTTDKQITGLSPDTTYYGLVTDEDWGRIQSISVAEMNSLTQYQDGYLPTNFTSETNVVSTYRQNLVENIPALWKRNCQPLLCFTEQVQAPGNITSTTATNIIGRTSTTFTASDPGYTVDLRGKARRGQSGVPCRVFVRMGNDHANTGAFDLYRDSGTLVTTINFTGSAEAWFSADVVLPAAVTKLYLMARCTVGASVMLVYACTIIMYE